MVAFSRPISDLPTEILIIIFHEARDLEVRTLDLTFWPPANHPAHPNSLGWVQGPRPATCPWNIAQVCQRWRAIALAIPELWSDVFLHIRADGMPRMSPTTARPPRPSTVQTSALRHILDRSHPAPLRFRLKATLTKYAREAHRAFLLISSYDHRIALLDIGLGPTLSLPTLDLTLPNVRHLSLRDKYMVDDDRGHLLLFVGSLRMSVLDRVDYFGRTLGKYTVRTSCIPWKRITVLNLRLDWISWPNILHLFAFTGRVETVSISSNGFSPTVVHDHGTPTSVIELPSLTSISFHLFQLDIISILSAIQTPDLRHLDLRALPYGDPPMIQPPDEVVLRALDHVACAQATLVTLRLVDIDLPHPLILNLLSSLDHLEHIAIRGASESFPDLTGIIQDWTTTSLSPQLQSISLMSSTWDYAPQGTLLQLVHNRCQLQGARRLGVRCLRQLHITRRLCPAHSCMHERDETDIRSLNLPSASVVWRDMDFDGTSPALRFCSYCHAGIGESAPPMLYHNSW